MVVIPAAKSTKEDLERALNKCEMEVFGEIDCNLKYAELLERIKNYGSEMTDSKAEALVGVVCSFGLRFLKEMEE